MEGWVQIISWHALRTWTRVPGRAITRCGRTVSDIEHALPDFPGDAKTCETCLRSLAKAQTRQVGEE
jgi:hypothetical protein